MRKDEFAAQLASGHYWSDCSIRCIYRLDASSGSQDVEAIKLLEVNDDAIPDGIQPICFGARDDMPYPYIIVEVTPHEFDQIKSGELTLPDKWALGPALPE